MIIKEHIPLAPHTTFKTGGPARFFCSVASVDELKEAVSFAREKKAPFFVLGGGSNVVIADAGFPGLVIKMEIAGKEVKRQKVKGKSEVKKEESGEADVITVGAGEMWDSFVEWTLGQGFNGLENLSAIPGTVGAAPVQNIGAYGTEVGYYISNVHALDTKTMSEIDIDRRGCHFGYRNSLFKHEKGRYVITHVDFALKRDGKVNLEYKDVREYFSKKLQVASDKLQGITPIQVREAVIDIRWNKLPDWTKWGTAGSFFKNPVVPLEKYDELKKLYPALPGFPENDAENGSHGVKLSLGWILDNVCKAKGMTAGAVGTYEKQALVIVAKPGATSTEIVAFTQKLMDLVKEKTGIVIEAEVQWVN